MKTSLYSIADKDLNKPLTSHNHPQPIELFAISLTLEIVAMVDYMII